MSVFGCDGKKVLVLHTYVLRVQYSCGVGLVFLFWREIDVGVTYVLSVQYSCAVVSIFWLWREIAMFLVGSFVDQIMKKKVQSSGCWLNRFEVP